MNILKLLFPLILCCGFYAQAQTVEEIDAITRAVVGICRGGTVEGNYEGYEISAGIEAGGVLLKVLGANAQGEVNIEKGTWDGIKAVVPEKWDANAYNQCVSTTLPLLTKNFSASPKDSSLNVTTTGPCSGVIVNSSNTNSEVECSVEN